MERSSFFNSINGDRKYNAAHWAEYFKQFIGNGIYSKSTSNLQILSNNNMSITAKDGTAFINGYFYTNTSDNIITLAAADGIQDRIDTIVLRLDHTTREIILKVLQGTPSSNPAAVAITRNENIFDLKLAEIRVIKGTIAIQQSNITDFRSDTTVCGWVKGLIEEIDTTNLFAQFEDSFNTWFDYMKDQLSTDAAGNLQTQLDTQSTRIADWETFKANGGTINAPITVNDKVNSKYVVSTDQYLRLFTNGSDGLIIDENAKRFMPQTGSKYKLGDVGREFTDLHLSGVSKNTNGYTKLPNGMIMQWGSISLASGSKTDFTPPIAFPTQCLIISATLVGGTTYSNLGVTSGINSNNSLYALQSTGATRPINWFAIGY